VEVNMVATGYCKCKKCCGWKRNWFGRPVVASGPSKGKKKKVGVTAAGTKAKPGTLAADVSKYPFGTVMWVPGYGYGRVEDRGSAIQGEHIDLYFKSHKQALQWGRQNVRVKVWR
jgi:3D (Asp-Asp-Asp) domain-containing protein